MWIQRQKDASGTLKAKVLPVLTPEAAAQNALLWQQVFIPSKEMVSLFKGLIALFEKFRDFPLDDTYRDLAVAMSTLAPRQPSRLLLEVVEPMRQQLGGQLRLQDDELVFERDDGSILLSQLLAEGHRKLAMLVYLIRNGVIERGSTLYWDEPEANLNPAALRLLASALHQLSMRSVQVLLATHSLFLLREFEILQMQLKSRAEPKPRYFGLGAKRGVVQVTQGDDVADIDPLVLLDESLQQSDRFLEAEQ